VAVADGATGAPNEGLSLDALEVVEPDLPPKKAAAAFVVAGVADAGVAPKENPPKEGVAVAFDVAGIDDVEPPRLNDGAAALDVDTLLVMGVAVDDAAEDPNEKTLLVPVLELPPAAAPKLKAMTVDYSFYRSALLK
jgi:hypothetical protein